MNCELLLYWMSHKGEGSWGMFRQSVEELSPDSADQNGIARRARVALSDLGHAEFFIDDSTRWKVLPPLLGGTPGRPETAVLTGARTPKLIQALEAASIEVGCVFSRVEAVEGLKRIELCGSAEKLDRVAIIAGIAFAGDICNSLFRGVISIAEQVAHSRAEEEPHQWEAEYFDLQEQKWRKGVKPNSACRFTPRNGPAKFLLLCRHRKFLILSKRESIYASAMLQGFKLVSYEPSTGALSVPLAAPLPAKLSRIGCLCSGIQPVLSGGALVYQNVPFGIAAAVMVAAGQNHPGMQLISEPRRRSVG
jgi:hypothetical protein